MEHEEQTRAAFPDDLPLPADLTRDEAEPSEHARPAHGWQALRRTLRAGVFSPTWLPAPWSTPLVGYVASLCLPAVMILLTLFVLHLFPTFALRGIFAQSTILAVALLWGTGPGVVATLFGASLLNYVLLPPPFSWSLSSAQPLLETGAFLAFGIAISLVVSRIEYARGEAERARQQVEQLVRQLEREKTQAAAQASELETIVAAIADGVFVYDSSGHVRRTNPAAQAFNPFTQHDDYLTLPFPERFASFLPRDEKGQPFAPEQLPVLRVLRGEVLNGSHAVDTLLRTVGGEDQLFNVSGAPIRDQAGHILGAVIVMREVTERRQLEQSTRTALDALLQMAQVMVQGVGAHAPISAVTRDPSREVMQRLAMLTRKVLGCHRLAITGVEPETEILRPLAVVGLSREQEQQWWQEQEQQTVRLTDSTDPAMLERFRAQDILSLDLTQPPYSEQPNPYGIRQMLVAPIGLATRLLGFFTLDYGGLDHTYTPDEIELTKAVTRLAALVMERDRLLAEASLARANEVGAREASRRMDEFIGIASHEIKTPLTSIKGNLQLARRRIITVMGEVSAADERLLRKLEDVQSLLGRAERQVGIQNRLVSDLVDVSRIRTDKLDLHPSMTDLATVVREAVQDQRLVAPTRSIFFETSQLEVPVLADGERIVQVVSNYLSNALKYSPEDCPVAVRLQVQDGLARVSVRDEGPGLSAEQQARIWERFYRVPEISVQSGSGVGLGLGLHICRIIIEQHKGQVGVDSARGRGATFWFSLPVAELNAGPTQEEKAAKQ